jgi:ABC-type nitrate/sulfonate/bicarbonate transport system permease component
VTRVTEEGARMSDIQLVESIDLAQEVAPTPSPSGNTVSKGSRARAQSGRVLRVVIPPLVLLTLLIGFWQWYVVTHHSQPTVLPSPGRVVRQGWQNRDTIWQNTKPTLQVTLIGFSLSLAVGWTLAILSDFSTWLRRGFMPILVASQTLPIIALAPLMILWFGFGILPKVLVVALVTFFPITISLIEGFGSAEHEATNLLRSMGANKWKRFRYVRLPSALPFFFAGLRIAITYAVVGAIFAEYVGAFKGLGIYMSVQKNQFRTDLVLAAVLVTALLSIGLFLATYLLQRICIPWYAKSRRRNTGAN